MELDLHGFPTFASLFPYVFYAFYSLLTVFFFTVLTFDLNLSVCLSCAIRFFRFDLSHFDHYFLSLPPLMYFLFIFFHIFSSLHFFGITFIFSVSARFFLFSPNLLPSFLFSPSLPLSALPQAFLSRSSFLSFLTASLLVSPLLPFPFHFYILLLSLPYLFSSRLPFYSPLYHEPPLLFDPFLLLFSHTRFIASLLFFLYLPPPLPITRHSSPFLICMLYPLSLLPYTHSNITSSLSTAFINKA